MKFDDKALLRREVGVNPAQLALMVLMAKNTYAIFSRATGKSYIMGAQIDENVRKMPRGITSVTQSTMLQALTKTLPSAFKMLETLGYKRWDPKTKTGDYVVRRTPPEGWYRPYEQILSYEYSITFSNGHMIYIFSQDGNSRGPSVDYNICDEALTLDKGKFDKESAPTNRGNEHVWGFLSDKPLMKHHGNLFLSSMPWEADAKWLLEPAKYYEEEKGIELWNIWNRIVSLQMQLIEAKKEGDVAKFTDTWNQTLRLRRTITPFVSKDGTLFMLANIFDNLSNIGLSYVMNEYATMDRLSFMVEVLNYHIDVVDDCYYRLENRHSYKNAVDSSYVRDFAENTDFDFGKLELFNDCRSDADLMASQMIDICPDWGATYSFMIVVQHRNYDFSLGEITRYPVDNVINAIYIKRDDIDNTLVEEMAARFCSYYEMHATKIVRFVVDRHGDAKSAASKHTYNELFQRELEKRGWKVKRKVHGGQEPPQHDKYLLTSIILQETRPDLFPKIRINSDKCKPLLGSMRNTRVVQKDGKFAKDKSSEHNKNLPQDQATHFGDCLDKYLWTMYGDRLRNRGTFIAARI